MDIGHWSTFLRNESFIVRSSLWLLCFGTYKLIGLLAFKVSTEVVARHSRSMCSYRKFSRKLILRINHQFPETHPSIAIACMHKVWNATKPVTSLSYICSLNDKGAASLLRTEQVSILQVLKIAFRRGLAYTRSYLAYVYVKNAQWENTASK